MVAVPKDNSCEILWRVAEAGEASALAEVLRKGIDIDVATVHGMTALMRAAAAGKSEIVRLLLEHGADPNRSRNDGFTPLVLAAFFGHKDVVKILIQHGADIDAATRFGTSAQMWAAARTCKEVVTYLQKPDKPLQPRRQVIQSAVPTAGSEHPSIRWPTLFTPARLIAACALFVLLGAGVTAINLRWTRKDTPTINNAITEEVRPAVTEPTKETPMLSHEPETLREEKRTKPEPTRIKQRIVVTANSEPFAAPKREPKVLNEIPVPATNPVIATEIKTTTPKRSGPTRTIAPPSSQLISPSKSSSKSGKVIAWP